MSSNFYKNNEVAHEVQSSVSPMLLPHFDIFCHLSKKHICDDKKGQNVVNDAVILMSLSSNRLWVKTNQNAWIIWLIIWLFMATIITHSLKNPSCLRSEMKSTLVEPEQVLIPRLGWSKKMTVFTLRFSVKNNICMWNACEKSVIPFTWWFYTFCQKVLVVNIPRTFWMQSISDT